MSKIVAEIFFLIGVVLGGFLFWQLIKGMKSRNWPTVQGRVIDSRMTTHVSRDDDGSRSTTYGAAISYRYDVDGDEYSGDK
ncbi:MAG: DUF3592 domain-containing protein, partial [Anaerolineaceae bacterium]|nr:DUF3592 domain-containing protein [Anaerolineaceae bacterium]